MKIRCKGGTEVPPGSPGREGQRAGKIEAAVRFERTIPVLRTRELLPLSYAAAGARTLT